MACSMARTREIAGLFASLVALTSGATLAQAPSSAALSQHGPSLPTAATSAPSKATARPGGAHAKKALHGPASQRADNDPEHAAPVDPNGEHDQLWRAYYYWSFVQLCYLGRTSPVYDEKLARARAATKAIERSALAKDPKANLDDTFAHADGTARTRFATGLLQGDKCTQALNALLAMRPDHPAGRPGVAVGHLSAGQQ